VVIGFSSVVVGRLFLDEASLWGRAVPNMTGPNARRTKNRAVI
jgi:hypothetical protein